MIDALDSPALANALKDDKKSEIGKDVERILDRRLLAILDRQDEVAKNTLVLTKITLHLIPLELNLLPQAQHDDALPKALEKVSSLWFNQWRQIKKELRTPIDDSLMEALGEAP